MDLLIGYFEDWPILVAFAMYWVFALRGTLSAGATRDHWLNILERQNWNARYNSLIDRALERVDGWWTPELSSTAPPFERDSLRAAFSGGLMNFALVFALAYPLLSLLLQWAWSGEAQNVGEVPVFLAADGWVRAVTIAAFAGVFLCFRAAEAKRRANGPTAENLLIAIGAAIPIIWWYFLSDLVGATGAGAFAGAGALAGALALAGAFAFAGVFAVTGAFAGAVGVAGAGVFAVTGAFAGAVGVAVAVAVAVEWLIRKVHRGAVILGIWAFIALGTILIAVSQASTIPLEGRSIILFIGILPLVNGLTDFLSIGATRWLLRRAHGAGAWRGVAWLADLGCALASFALLAGAFIAIAVLIRPQDGVPLLEITQFLTDIVARPGDHWWLAIVVFTTFLPTAIHLIIALYSGMLLVAPIVRPPIARLLRSDIGSQSVTGYLALVAFLTVAWGLPTVVVWEGAQYVWSGAPDLKGMALDAAHWWAGYLTQWT